MNISKMNIKKEKINISNLTIGSIWITLLCHSFCCILPMFSFIVGINMVGTILHDYEGYFIVLNLLAIVVGFYLTYFHKKKKHCDHKNCHSTNKKFYWISTIISLIVMYYINF
jgi:lipoprotein signal peptidase